MKITRLPDVSKEILYRLLEKSIYTVEELLPQTHESLMPRLEDEILTQDVLGFLRETAMQLLSQDERVVEQTYPDMHSLCAPELKMSLLPLSDYLKKKISSTEPNIKFFDAYSVSPVMRIAFSEYLGISEKTANKLFVYVKLLESYEEDREDFDIEFTRSLFTKLETIPDIDTNRMLKLREAFVYTIGDLEDSLSSTPEMEKLIAETKFNADILKDILKTALAAELPPETPEEIKQRFTIDPLPIMYDIVGMAPAEIEEIWKGESKESVPLQTLEVFRTKTQTKKLRDSTKMLQKTKASMIFLSEMADFMMIPTMTPFDAEKLIGRGIHSVKDLAKTDIFYDGVIRDVSFGMASERVIPYIIAAREIHTEYESEYDVSDKTESDAEEVLSDGKISLSEMLTQIGKGIGQAQRELDMTALEMQKEILKNREMAEYGLQPTWFTMPEIDFSLKMEYNVTRTENEDGTLTSKQVDITPINAKYKNMFTSAVKEESSLKIKFVPVPPIEAFVQRREVPDMIGMTAEEARAALAESGIRAIVYTALYLPSEYPVGDDRTEVVHQSVKPGEYLGIGEMLFVLTVFRRRARAA